MNEILEELYKELVPDIPENAITKKMLVARGDGKISASTAQRILESKVENEDWIRVKYKGENYYWPPE